MTRETKIKPETVNRIQTLAHEGHSANYIQKRLRQDNLGIRRTVLLAEVRRAKHQEAKHHVERYVPRKYRERQPSYISVSIGRQITLIGRHHGRRAEKQQQGSGRELYDFVRKEMNSGYWDAKPRVTSE